MRAPRPTSQGACAMRVGTRASAITCQHRATPSRGRSFWAAG
jgi:hypothetical protein